MKTQCYQIYFLPTGKKYFLLQPVECWKTPSRERNISEHDIIQINTEMFFSLDFVGIWNRNRQIDFG